MYSSVLVGGLGPKKNYSGALWA